MSKPDNSGRYISNGEIIDNQKEKYQTNIDFSPLNYEFEKESHIAVSYTHLTLPTILLV